MVVERLRVNICGCGYVGRITGVNILTVDGCVGEAKTSEADENFLVF